MDEHARLPAEEATGLPEELLALRSLQRAPVGSISSIDDDELDAALLEESQRLAADGVLARHVGDEAVHAEGVGDPLLRVGVVGEQVIEGDALVRGAAPAGERELELSGGDEGLHGVAQLVAAVAEPALEEEEFGPSRGEATRETTWRSAWGRPAARRRARRAARTLPTAERRRSLRPRRRRRCRRVEPRRAWCLGSPRFPAAAGGPGPGRIPGEAAAGGIARTSGWRW